MPSIDDYVIDPYVAHWVHDYLQSSARFVMPDDEKISYLVFGGEGQQSYFRWMDNAPRKSGAWMLEQRDSPLPEVVQSLPDELRDADVSRVNLSFISYTTLGSWYTAEADEQTPGSASLSPIRVPVPDDMIPRVREWAGENGGEVSRVKGVEFKDRFAEVVGSTEARRLAGELNDVHVEIHDIGTEQEFKRLFREATDFAERGVRSVR